MVLVSSIAMAKSRVLPPAPITVCFRTPSPETISLPRSLSRVPSLNPVAGEEMTVGMSARTPKKDRECIFDILDNKDSPIVMFFWVLAVVRVLNAGTKKRKTASYIDIYVVGRESDCETFFAPVNIRRVKPF